MFVRKTIVDRSASKIQTVFSAPHNNTTGFRVYIAPPYKESRKMRDPFLDGQRIKGFLSQAPSEGMHPDPLRAAQALGNVGADISFVRQGVRSFSGLRAGCCDVPGLPCV